MSSPLKFVDEMKRVTLMPVKKAEPGEKLVTTPFSVLNRAIDGRDDGAEYVTTQ